MWKRSVMVVAATVALAACAETPAPVAPDADVAPAFNNVQSPYGNLDLKRSSATKSGDAVKINFRINGAGNSTLFVGADAVQATAQVLCYNKNKLMSNKGYGPVDVTPSSADAFQPDRTGTVSGTVYIFPPSFISDGVKNERCPSGQTRVVQYVYYGATLFWGPDSNPFDDASWSFGDI